MWVHTHWYQNFCLSDYCLSRVKNIHDRLLPLKQAVGHEVPGLGSYCVIHDDSDSGIAKEENLLSNLILTVRYCTGTWMLWYNDLYPITCLLIKC